MDTYHKLVLHRYPRTASYGQLNYDDIPLEMRGKIHVLESQIYNMRKELDEYKERLEMLETKTPIPERKLATPRGENVLNTLKKYEKPSK